MFRCNRNFFLATTAVQAKQMGDRQDWKVRKLNRLVGEICEEDKSLQPPYHPKCATLTVGGGFIHLGEASKNVENNGLVPVTDYLSCMTWFGQTAGDYPTEIQILCKNGAKGDGMTDVNISRFTTSVLTK
jgi:hypothetical protein